MRRTLIATMLKGTLSVKFLYLIYNILIYTYIKIEISLKIKKKKNSQSIDFDKMYQQFVCILVYTPSNKI